MDEERRAFYEYHAALMEPWDGPAAMAFTDGRQIGATLDRNGLRPARYFVTDDDLVVLASEMGVLPVPEESIIAKWRLQPGKMLLVDLEQHRIVSDAEIKQTLSRARPYSAWLREGQIVLEDLNPVEPRTLRTDVPLLDRQQAFGYTQEDLTILLAPMAATGQEAVGSMGTDTPISALSSKSKLLYTYFKQNFAQVTNPPIDPIREELVMSLVSFIGPRPNLFDLDGAARRKRLEVRQPILTNEDLEKIRSIGHLEDSFDTRTLDITYPVKKGASGMREALTRLCERAESAVHGRYNIIILSDRMVGPDRIPIPALLATAAVHHHLIRKGLRTSVGLVVETGEAREIHHFACLASYGAEAINPYLAFETLTAMAKDLPEPISGYEAVKRFIKSVDKGLLKVMSKMGISTYQSYCGAQIVDAVGLSRAFIDEFFFGTATSIEGRRLDRDRGGDTAPPRGCVRPFSGPEHCARGRGRIRISRAWRDPQLDAGDGLPAAARRSRQRRRSLQCLCQSAQRAECAIVDNSRSLPNQDRGGGRANVRSDRRSRARGFDRQALLDRGDVLRFDFARGAHHARHRNEPDRRQVKHRRRR